MTRLNVFRGGESIDHRDGLFTGQRGVDRHCFLALLLCGRELRQRAVSKTNGQEQANRSHETRWKNEENDEQTSPMKFSLQLTPMLKWLEVTGGQTQGGHRQRFDRFFQLPFHHIRGAVRAFPREQRSMKLLLSLSGIIAVTHLLLFITASKYS